MIFQIDYWAIIRGFFNWVSESAAIMMVLSGIMAITWFGYEKNAEGLLLKEKLKKNLMLLNFCGGYHISG